MRVAALVLLAFGLAALTYLRLERLGTRAWIPLVCRGIAWAALGLLLLNVSCPAPAPVRRPLMLLDVSLSMSAPGVPWQAARDSAHRWGEVRAFGDERAGRDSLPARGRSLLAPALLAAAAADRPVIVVTDGEIEDADQIPRDIVARTGVRLFPRAPRPDLALVRVEGPARVASGDSIPLEVEVRVVGGATVDSVRVEVVAGESRLAQRTVRLRGPTAGRARLVVPSALLGAGDHLLRLRLRDPDDAEPRTDARLHLVTVARTPGVVLLASPGDWDTRFLYRTLRDVAQLPVRGYLRLADGRWRSMTDLAPLSQELVRQAARRADLLIVKGAVGDLTDGAVARGLWTWPGSEGTEPVVGDWYLSAADASPLAGAFLGQPVDSFPPALRLTPAVPVANEWVALSARLGRRGPERPAVTGREEGRVRRVAVLVDGLWRWAFRGEASEQVYRSWVAATASWLLAGADSAAAVARPVRPVVPNGRPLVFEWAGSGPPRATPIALTGPGAPVRDTLRFDGGGRASLWLPPGEYRYRLGGGGGGVGTAAVEPYSDEFLPAPVTLEPREPAPTRSMGRTAAREWLWLFGLCLLALSGEWLARRRLGLR